MVALHVLAIPYPAQGHVMPLMETCLLLLNHGIRVTFVNTVFNHERVVKSLSDANIEVPELMELVSIHDGMQPYEDRDDFVKLVKSILQFMPENLRALIDDINNGGGATGRRREDNKVTCVIADETMGWALDVAEKMGIKTRIAFWPLSALTLALEFSFQRLIDDGIINSTGSLLNKNARMVQLSPGMPMIDPKDFVWICMVDENMEKAMFDLMERANKTVKKATLVICNTTEALEKATLNSFPEIIPIGRPMSSYRLGSFWSEDHHCLTWLNEQPPQSVVYVAFGSITIFNPTQFHELATGLELSNKRFLWVVRPNLLRTGGDGTGNNDDYLTGFKNRVLGRGRLFSWVPQQKVLSHPSLACFVSHCGWNSTVEGINNGLPFLCWPYVADQFLNRSYICGVWKVGLEFTRNENRIIESGEIKNKIDQVLGDESFRTRALELKTSILDHLKEDGSSKKNFMNLINSIID